MKMEAVSHQGIACGQVGHKSRDNISDTDSGRQVQRYIRLTYLIPEFLEKMDKGEIALSVGVELSYLNEIRQQDVLEQCKMNDCTPSYSQAWVIQSEQPFRIYGGEGSSVMTSSDGTEVCSYRVNVRRLCMVLCLCAKGYYKENKDKFDFYNYELIDWDKVTASLPPIDMEEMFRKLSDPSLSEKEHSGESADE